MENLILTFLILPLFILACIFSFLIPGLFTLTILGYKKEKDIPILATAVGVSLFLLLIYVLSWVQLNYGPLLVLGVINILYLLKYRDIFYIRFNKEDKILYSIIGVGSLVFVGLTWFSGWDIFGRTNFYGVNAEDGLIHLSRIYNLIQNFPPTHPGLAEVPFRGYHYFYDLLLSRFVMYFQFSPYDLYFRFFSLFVAIFYGWGLLYFSKEFTKSKVALYLILIFAYFSAGFSLFLSFFHLPYSSNFAHPLLLIFDPSVLFSIALLCVVLRLLPSVRNSFKRGIVVALILGILCQLKIYAGIIGISVLVIYSLYAFVKYGRKVLFYFTVVNIMTCLITIITFLPNNFGSGSLIFNPFVFYTNYIQQPFFDFLQWENKRVIFAMHNNYPRLIFLYIQAIILFWVITLGVRLIILKDGRRLIKKSFWRKDYNFMLVILFLTSITLGSLFIQSTSVFDIMQFTWIAMVFLSIPTGIALAQLLKDKKRIFYITSFLFMVTSIGLIYKEYSHAYMQQRTAYHVSIDDKKVYNKVENTVPTNEFITILPSYSIAKEGNAVLNTYPPSVVSAMTGRSTYFENEKIEYNLNEIYSERKGNLFSMHNALDSCDQQSFTNAFKRTGTAYLVVQFHSPCLATHSAFFELASSEKAVFYILEEK